MTPHRLPLHLLAVLGAVLAAMCIGAASASAASSYGELSRFGERGEWGKSDGTKATPKGEIAGPGHEKETIEEPNYALGVDTSEANAVFVLDEPNRVKETEHAELVVSEHHVRIQKFVGGKATASVSFTVTSPQVEEEEDVEAERFSNIAVDSAHGVLYVLSEEPRKYNLVKDVEAPVAYTLYAFKTKATGEALEPAGKSGTDVLAGPAELQAESEEAGKPLIEPAGITVDPTTHDVIILGHVDETGGAKDVLSSDHYALERVSEAGVVGQRYVDKTNFFKTGRQGGEPSSPVVTGSGHVLVRFEGIAEVPSNFAETTAPKQVYPEPTTGEVKSVLTFGLENESGGALSLSPEETLYEPAGIDDEAIHEANGNNEKSGVAERTTGGALIGWSGGQSQLIEKKDQCVLEAGAKGAELPLDVAAGAAGKVIVLAPEYLLKKESGGFEPATTDALIELGPTGTGCPEAAGSTVSMSEHGVSVPESEPVLAGEKVAFSMPIAQADALAAEWTIENEATKETVVEKPNPLEFDREIVEGVEGKLLLQQPKLSYTFTTSGKFLVSAKIGTDDLATPSVQSTAPRHVTVESAKGSGPEAPKVTREPSSVTVTEPEKATFIARASGSPAPKVEWEVSTNEGKTFTHDTTDTGNTSETLTITSTSTSDSGREYRAAFSNTLGNATSQAATLTVKAKPAATTGPPPPPNEPTGTGGVLPTIEVKPPPAVPTAKIASTSISVSRAGALTLKVSCPAGETRCIGNVTLRTLTAVLATSPTAHGANKPKRKIVTLASGSFSVAGGATGTVKLHLSSVARSLLAHAHSLRAKATLIAHDLAGSTHKQEQVLTLRLAKH